MTWTYDGDPTANDRDKVRFLIADTDNSDQLLSDEEIAFTLADFPNAYRAAALACFNLAMRFARKADVAIDSLKVSYSNRSKEYQSLASSLEDKALSIGSALGVPYVGGVSIADRNSVNDDTDRVKPAFVDSKFNNPPYNDADLLIN